MGYAVAEDHAVEMGKLYLQARGEAARWFGPAYLDDDFAMRRMDNLAGARRALERTGFRLVSAGMTYCISNPEAAEADGYPIDEVEKMFLRLA